MAQIDQGLKGQLMSNWLKTDKMSYNFASMTLRLHFTSAFLSS